jgi:hypothetical protein
MKKADSADPRKAEPAYISFNSFILIIELIAKVRKKELI